jgi:hypothetical protein
MSRMSDGVLLQERYEKNRAELLNKKVLNEPLIRIPNRRVIPEHYDEHQ